MADVEASGEHRRMDGTVVVDRRLRAIRWFVDAAILYVLTAILQIFEPDTLRKWNEQLAAAVSPINIGPVSAHFFSDLGHTGVSAGIYGIPVSVVGALLQTLLFTATLGPLGPIAALGAAGAAVTLGALVFKGLGEGFWGIAGGAVAATVGAFVLLLVFVLIGQILVFALLVAKNAATFVAAWAGLGAAYAIFYTVIEEKTKDWIDRRVAEWILRNWFERPTPGVAS